VGPPYISFIVPVRNDKHRLERCIRSIQANNSSAASIEVVVVDNGSTDGSAEAAAALGAKVIRRTVGRVAELRNIGAEAAGGAILAFVDADHEIGPAWGTAARASLNTPDIAAAGALCHAPSDGSWVQRAYGLLRGIPEGRSDTEWLGSGNLAIRKDVFRSLGGFDTTLTTCEDVDLCNRVRAAGFRIVSDSELINVHYGDPAALGELFKGELWRGQDNLRVTFRGPLSWRALPSIVIPIVDLLMMGILILAGVATLVDPSRGVRLAAAAAICLIGASAPRVFRAVLAGRCARPMQLLQLWTVACVYDWARALALVWRAPHRSSAPTMAAPT
jgi:glycosyl transferase family 2